MNGKTITPEKQAAALLRYLADTASLMNRQPVHDIMTYKDENIVWLHDLPEAFRTLDWSKKNSMLLPGPWVKIPRPELPETPPEPPEDIRRWLNKKTIQNACLEEEPVLLDKIRVGHEFRFFCDLDDQDALRITLNDYLNLWREWAKKQQMILQQKKTYEQLFSMDERYENDRNKYELVLGIGLLLWLRPVPMKSTVDVPTDSEEIDDASLSTEGDESLMHPILIRRHLFTIPCDITVNTSDLLVVPAIDGSCGDDVCREEDMLPNDELTTGRRLEEILKAVERYNEGESDVAELEDLVNQWGSLHKEVQPLESELAPPKIVFETPDAVPRIWMAPAVILRKRSTKPFDVFFGKAESQLKCHGLHTFSGHWRKLAGEKCDVDSNKLDDFASEHLYFPLPATDKQYEIGHQIDKGTSLSIIGPPGTGKSTLIANTICHLLATGRSVLVVSEEEQALSVLRDKLPAELRNLCVSRFRNDDSILRQSINAIRTATQRSRATDLQYDERIGEAEKNIQLADNELKCIADTITEWRALSNQKLDKIIGFDGTRQVLADEINRNTEEYSWILDLFSDPSDIPQAPESLPLDENVLNNLLNERKDLDNEDPALMIGALFPGEIELPSLGEIQKLATEVEQAIRLDAGVSCMPVPEEHAFIMQQNAKWFEALGHSLEQFYEKGNVSWRSRCANAFIMGDDAQWNLLKETLFRELSLLSIIRHQHDETALYTNDIHTQTGSLLFLPLDELKQLRNIAEKLYQPLHKVTRYLRFLSNLQETEEFRQDSNRIAEVVLDGERFNEQLTWNRQLSWLRRLITGIIHRQLFVLLEETGVELRDANVECIDQVARAFRDDVIFLEKQVGKLGKILKKAADKPIGSSPKIDLDTLSRLCQARETHLKVEKMQHAWEQQYAVLQNLSTMYEGIVYPGLVEAAERGDWGLYAKYHQMAERHSKWSRTIRKTPHLTRLEHWLKDQQVPVVESWQESWLWVTRQAWIRDDNERHDPHSLFEKRKEWQEVRSQNLALAAVAHAWKACVAKVDDELSSHLAAWDVCIKNLPKSPYAKSFSRKMRDARQQLDKCLPAVPAWIMTLKEAVTWFGPRRFDDDSISASERPFDVAIIDEASQSRIEALALILLAKQVIVIGDEKQNSPNLFGLPQVAVDNLIKTHLSSHSLSTMLRYDRSFLEVFNGLFCMARYTLQEHFRCMPEIIQFCNDYVYTEPGEKLYPLKQFGSGRLYPVIKTVYVADGKTTGDQGSRMNSNEARALVEKLVECCGIDDYGYGVEKKSMGIISLLGVGQAECLKQELDSPVGPGAMEIRDREIQVGTSRHFQGDERDVIFLSLGIASNNPIAARTTDDAMRQFNVAVSRAKEQLWLFHSVPLAELRNPADYRHKLLAHCHHISGIRQPESLDIVTSVAPRERRGRLATDSETEEYRALVSEKRRSIENKPSDFLADAPFDSWFELDVYIQLINRNYDVMPQYPVFSGDGIHSNTQMYLDLVVEGRSGSIVIECDGTRHYSDQKFVSRDLNRQLTLEQCGWIFYRLRSVVYYLNPGEATDAILDFLDKMGVFPRSEECDPEIVESEEEQEVQSEPVVQMVRDEEQEEYEIDQPDQPLVDAGNSAPEALPSEGPDDDSAEEGAFQSLDESSAHSVTTQKTQENECASIAVDDMPHEIKSIIVDSTAPSIQVIVDALVVLYTKEKDVEMRKSILEIFNRISDIWTP